jgi:hypothetical protein
MLGSQVQSRVSLEGVTLLMNIYLRLVLQQDSHAGKTQADDTVPQSSAQ